MYIHIYFNVYAVKKYNQYDINAIGNILFYFTFI
jgi:hypothetical protein